MAVGYASVQLTLDDKAVLSGLKNISKIIDSIGSTKIKLDIDTSSIKKASDSLTKITGTNSKIPTPNLDISPIGSSLNKLEAQLSIAQERYQNLFTKQTPPNTAQIKQAELSIASIKQRIQDVQDKSSTDIFAGLKNSMSSVSNVASGFASVGSKIVSTLGDIVLTAGKAAVAIGAVGATAFIAGAKSSLEYAGSLQKAKGDLTILLGSQEKSLKVIKEMTKFAGTTPFETGDLIKVSAVLGTVIKDTDKLNLRVKQLGEASGGNVEGFNRMANTFSQVVGKGKADTVDLKEFVNAGFVNIRSVAEKELGLTGQAFEDAVSSGKLTAEVVGNILDKATAGFPRMAEAAKTLPGLFSTASDAIKTLGLRIIGVDEDLNFIKGGVADLASQFLFAFGSEGVQKELTALGVSISNIFTQLFGVEIKPDENAMANTIRVVREQLDALPAKIDVAKQAIIDFFNTPLGTAIKEGFIWIRDFLLDAPSRVNTLQTEFEKLKDTSWAKAIKTAVDDTFKTDSNGESGASKFIGNIKKGFEDFANNPAVKPFLTQLEDIFKRLEPTLKILEGLIIQIKDAFIAFITNPVVQAIILGAITVAIEAIIFVINNLITGVNVVATVFRLAFAVLEYQLNTAKESIKFFYETFKDIFENGLSGSFDRAMKRLDGFKDNATKLFSDLKKAVLDFIGSIKIPEIKLPFSTGGIVPNYKANGGMIYANNGKYIKKGTDTVPAMLTPGEFVINKEATQKNKALLASINSSKVDFLGNLSQRLGSLLPANVLSRSLAGNSESKNVTINVNYSGGNMQADNRFLFNLQNLANTSML